MTPDRFSSTSNFVAAVSDVGIECSGFDVVHYQHDALLQYLGHAAFQTCCICDICFTSACVLTQIVSASIASAHQQFGFCCSAIIFPLNVRLFRSESQSLLVILHICRRPASKSPLSTFAFSLYNLHSV
ncbi:hypothetical protein ABBQ32_002289 [Trebouxia sp. C0010 RCD-2024]